MKSEVIRAATLEVVNCVESCSCQLVHVLLLDGDGDPLAAASCDPQVARNIARDMERSADLAEARTVRQEGRLA